MHGGSQGASLESRGATTGQVLVVDDNAASCSALAALLAEDGHKVLRAGDAHSALDLIRRELPDVVLTDVQMPGVDGLELCRRVKSDAHTRLIPVILVTGFNDREVRIEGIRAGADDFLTKPVGSVELQARVRSLIKLRRFTDDLDSAESIILSLASTIEARDRYTSGHCQRMASYAAQLGMQLGLGDDEVTALRRGGYLHDIGKIGIPDAILLKPGRLSDDEQQVMRQHTVIGDRLCDGLRLLRLVRPIVRHHHERLDGSGYPDGLRGDAIPLLAQIMGVVDVYDALTTDRPYRAGLPPGEALHELEREVARGWRDQRLVAEFAALCTGTAAACPATSNSRM